MIVAQRLLHMGQLSWRDIILKMSFFFKVLHLISPAWCTVDTQIFSSALKHLPEPGYIFSAPFSLMEEKNQVSTVHHVGEIKCQTLKKNNIIPGKFYPYGVGSYNHV